VSDPDTPVLHLIVGVNGAGKTTFYYRQLRPYLAEKFTELPFVNADEIQRARGLTSDPRDAYEAARMAAETRVLQGGHDVPPHKIAERFPRTLQHVREAVAIVDRCYVYDNSLLGGRRSLVMSIRKGQRPFTRGPLPAWVTELYEDQLRDTGRKD
jgi:predicted ABC-type ATPase